MASVRLTTASQPNPSYPASIEGVDEDVWAQLVGQVLVLDTHANEEAVPFPIPTYRPSASSTLDSSGITRAPVQ